MEKMTKIEIPTAPFIIFPDYITHLSKKNRRVETYQWSGRGASEEVPLPSPVLPNENELFGCGGLAG